MKRAIYEVQKKIFGATVGGYVSNASGYPKIFNSHSSPYNDDIDATLLAATGAFAQAWSEICTTKGPEMQTAILMTADGFVIDKKTVGELAEIPEEVQK